MDFPLCSGRALGGDDEFSPGWNNIILLLSYALQLCRLCNAISTVFPLQLLLHRGREAPYPKEFWHSTSPNCMAYKRLQMPLIVFYFLTVPTRFSQRTAKTIALSSKLLLKSLCLWLTYRSYVQIHVIEFNTIWMTLNIIKVIIESWQVFNNSLSMLATDSTKYKKRLSRLPDQLRVRYGWLQKLNLTDAELR